MRILIVKLGSIGDIVHTLPSLAAIRHALPDAEIAWAVETSTAEILRGNEMIDRVIEVDTRSLRAGKALSDAAEQLRELRGLKFNVAIDFQGLWKSAAVAKLSGAKRRWGFAREGLREPASRVLLTDTVKTPKQVHVIRKNLALAAGALGIDVPDNDFEFPIAVTAAHRDEAAEIAELAGGDLAILNPGGGWVTKLWPAEKFGELADRLWNELGIVSVVTTGPGEEHLAEQITVESRRTYTVPSQLSLKAFYELAKCARVYVGGDTGPTHIAVAAGAPVVGLFGPTEWWRNGSIDPEDICVERNDIDCRIDCHRRTCDKWICMDIEVDAVLAAVKRRLSKPTEMKSQN